MVDCQMGGMRTGVDMPEQEVATSKGVEGEAFFRAFKTAGFLEW